MTPHPHPPPPPTPPPPHPHPTPTPTVFDSKRSKIHKAQGKHNNNHLMGVSSRRADRKSSPATDFLSEVGWTVPRDNTVLFSIQWYQNYKIQSIFICCFDVTWRVQLQISETRNVLNVTSSRKIRTLYHVLELPIHGVKHHHTVYPKKYAHGCCFAGLCCGYTLTDFPISTRLTSLALWQSNDCPSASKATLMNMDKYFMWIYHKRLHNHNKAKHNKTVCIFLGIYSMPWWPIMLFLHTASAYTILTQQASLHNAAVW